MVKQKMSPVNFLFFFIISLLISCTTNPDTKKAGLYDRKDPYPGMEILRFPNSQAYLFPNEGSDKLIIVMGGSGWESVLGIKKKNNWEASGLVESLFRTLHDSCTLLVLEKLKRQPGLDYEKDMDDRENYTAENLIACYSDSIDGYLGDHEFSSVIIVGGSEGAMLLPLVYEKIIKKDKVTALVAIAFGGLSWYESYQIISSTRAGITPEVADLFNEIFDTFDPVKTEFPDSFEEKYQAYSYRYYSSTFNIKPFDYYKNIDIPVLFIQGVYDINVAVESTFYVQDNLPDKPFDYRYFLWAHGPDTNAEWIHFEKRLTKWILNLP